MTQHDQKQDGCCGSEKHRSYAELEKEKAECCSGGKDKKPQTNNAKEPKIQGSGCCGGGTK